MKKRIPRRTSHPAGVFPPKLKGGNYVKEVTEYIEKFSKALSLTPSVFIVRGKRITA